MEKYSSEVQKAISQAEAAAFRFSHSLVGSEHLLLGLLKSENALSKELKAYKITYDAVAKRVRELYPVHEESPLYMEYTIELKSLLDMASSISRQYREDAVSVAALGSALFISENTMAYEILKKMKVDLRAVGQTLQKRLQKKSELASVSDLHCLADLHRDPLIGREQELQQLICALSRRNKPNAILVGEPGVGKTAIVEELAKLLKEGKVPSLKDKMIYELDLAATVGGTKYRGEFEEKIKKILKKVMEDGNCILFIDEIHNVIKAGGAEGAIDASNIIKPYLSRGEIQLIGATTEDEFQSVFEKDKALKRRFQVIKIEPSTPEDTKIILKKIKSLYEEYYHLKIGDDALEYIVDLAENMIPNYYFPDKAIDILDNACVISGGSLTRDAIDATVESFFKIRVNSFDRKKVALSRMREELMGQSAAIARIEENLALMECGVIEKDRPMLSLLFLGPSGVGKTQAARIIGETYFGKDHIIHLDMSSYQEMNALSKLIGVGAGYAGQEINPKLVRELKAYPKSLILLDEIEKANNEVLDFFLAMMDQGVFDSAKGEKIDCRSAMILMTSNYGFDTGLAFRDRLTVNAASQEYLIGKLQRRFRFEFLSRIDDIIVFSYLDAPARREIARKYLSSYRMDAEFAEMEEILLHKEEEYAKFGARAVKKDVRKAVLSKTEQKQS